MVSFCVAPECSNRVTKSISYYGIYCRGNVQLAVSIESMFEIIIVICDIGDKQCEELNFCGVVWVD